MKSVQKGVKWLTKAFTENDTESSQLLPMFLHSLDVHQRDQNGNTILHYAARTKDILKLHLVTQIVDHQDRSIINYYNKYGQHCLHIAIASSTLQIVKYLIQWGNIDVNIPDLKTGNTPLHIAIMYKNDAVLTYLLAKKRSANIILENKDNLTAYDLAVMLGNAKARFLLTTHILRSVKIKPPIHL